MTNTSTLTAASTKQRAKKSVLRRNTVSGQFIESISLADPAAAADVAAFRKKITQSPETARQWLNQVGILTPTGKLSRRYGGK